MTRTAFNTVKKVLVKAGQSTSQDVSGSVFYCSECDGPEFKVQLNEGETFPIKPGQGVILRNAQTFQKLTFSNESDLDLNLEYWAGNVDIIDARQLTQPSTRVLGSGYTSCNETLHFPEIDQTKAWSAITHTKLLALPTSTYLPQGVGKQKEVWVRNRDTTYALLVAPLSQILAAGNNPTLPWNPNVDDPPDLPYLLKLAVGEIQKIETDEPLVAWAHDRAVAGGAGGFLEFYIVYYAS